MLPNFTFGLAISTYIGQNIGAGRTDRIRPGETAGFPEWAGPRLREAAGRLGEGIVG